MSVGVARTAVGGGDVNVGGMDGCGAISAVAVGLDKLSGELGEERVCIEKLHPSIDNELKAKIRTDRNHLREFITSLFPPCLMR